MHSKAILTSLILLLCFPLKGFSEGQNLDFSGRTYISGGINVCYRWGSIKEWAWGPELSIGRAYSDLQILSGSVGFLLNGNDKGWSAFMKANGGTMLAGASIGPSLHSIDKQLKFGLDSEIWMGVIGYGTAAFRLIPGHSEFAAGARSKLPFLISK